MTPDVNETLSRANQLTDALKENTTALRAVKARFRFILVFVLAITVVLAISIKSRYDGRTNACSTDNELRSGLLHIADQIEATSSDSERARVFIDSLREDFALRDCDQIAWI